ncbi:RNA-directed DNA polymerase (reverse transcriptase)-related family protein [Rhynchospora pubera]|uniref:RNA-directed DNA polymerase (Reverse transcriptase)-related family protein n=1 Tax=Rhynchospora pubera TaxID=906938 RepID=A0AAV8HDJ2_9POAL|nr:RNA-directed DNA polymerase (reverse transcriptase)-related family protein [Rhynchospora pubera]
MTLVAWKNITVPKHQGGLGLKDLRKFAQSVHMRYLWSLISESKSLWVQLVKAKYLQRGTIWSTKGSNRSTTFWKALLTARSLLRDHIRWNIGDGRKCKAENQPWFDLWLNYQPINAVQRNLLVADLVNEANGGWYNEKLIQAFGFHGALYIAITMPNGPGLNGTEDKLLFTAATNGQFTLKNAYNLLLGHTNSQSLMQQAHKKVYNAIWHLPGVQPRARLFLWKAVKEALPVDMVLSHRLGKSPQGCILCGSMEEDVVHSLFKCPKAMQVWLASQFGLRTDLLPNSVMEIMMDALQVLDGAQIVAFFSVAWHLWKYRCKEVFEGTKLQPQQVLGSAHRWSQLLSVTVNRPVYAVSNSSNNHAHVSCYLDGSWVHDKEGGAGIAYILFSTSGTLIQYHMHDVQANSPFHAELLALRMAVNEVAALGYREACFLSDCLQLCNIVNGISGLDAVEWQLYSEVLDVIASIKGEFGFHCIYVGREDNQLADGLAKYARINRVSNLGFTFPSYSIPNCNAVTV